MKQIKQWYAVVFRYVERLWIKFGWRKAVPFGMVLLGVIVVGFLALWGEPQTAQRQQENAGQLAQTTNAGAPTPADTATTNPNASQTSNPNDPKSPTPTSTPKTQNQPQTPTNTGASLTFSAGEVVVHAGWDSSQYTASISNGQEFSGLSKEWNDNSPFGIVMPLGTKTGKTVSFLVSAPVTVAPGTYTVKVRASGAGESYTANLKVRVLPPLVAFDSITYDDDLEGFVIVLNVHENFSGDPVVQLASAPNGTPCESNYYSFFQIDRETFTFECLIGLDDVSGSFPLTFSVTGAGKTWTKSVTWTL